MSSSYEIVVNDTDDLVMVWWEDNRQDQIPFDGGEYMFPRKETSKKRLPLMSKHHVCVKWKVIEIRCQERLSPSEVSKVERILVTKIMREGLPLPGQGQGENVTETADEKPILALKQCDDDKKCFILTLVSLASVAFALIGVKKCRSLQKRISILQESFIQC
eukprot:gnl/MRDRNA2_/MRDRNA2_31619_c0_seq1.p1 gnl/MRDRNA2_/MRDRNA2_31619_c0~~gnl/MRDRNA2_/MRDRNA2_31619_c0_seq1.p1  ORF type:complete len:162 (-),score=27.62 gnl/MRDRNA2_/MRDRNA2_31619_c0_seq1:19-504(-)